METESIPPEQSEQKIIPPMEDTAPLVVPATGRAAFRHLKRELSDEDLNDAGARKLILEMLFTAETDREEYKAYVVKYWELAVRVGVLTERLRSDKTNETLFTVGVGVGGAIVGLAATFWTQQPTGWISLVVGFVLILGSVFARIRFREDLKSNLK